MRVLAPGVVLTSLTLFGTGVALLLAGPDESGSLKFLHKASFIAWFALMSVHVLGHLLELPSLALPDWRRSGGREAALAGSGLRLALLATSIAAGLGLALATISLAGPGSRPPAAAEASPFLDPRLAVAFPARRKMDRPISEKERSMNNRRAKLMAGATVLGLGALGGVAMGTNQGIPAPQQLAANGSGAVVTSASGVAAAQPAVAGASATTRPPIVTRASGGAAPVELDD